jgi:hypothetical protein
MDGTTKDNFFRGRLFRPASAEQAAEEYIPIVYMLASRNIRPTCHSDASGVIYYSLPDPNGLGKPFFIRKEDLDKCSSVAKKMGDFRIFPSEPQSSISGRIRALLLVEFSI